MTDLEGIMTSCYLAGNLVTEDYAIPKISALELHKNPSTFNIVFGSAGTLSINENGKVEFEGDMEESAKAFFEYLQNYIKVQISISK